MRPDLILDHANVITIDADRPRAGSIAILGATIDRSNKRGRQAFLFQGGFEPGRGCGQKDGCAEPLRSGKRLDGQQVELMALS